MRIAGEDKALDAQICILQHALRDRVRIADERGTGAAADQADAGPQIRTYLEVRNTSLHQRGHSLLPFGIKFRQTLMGSFNGFLVDVLDEIVSSLPRFRSGLANDYVQAD